MESKTLKVSPRIFKNSFLTLLFLLILSGCGYHFPAGDESRFPHLRTFFVESFVNRTSEAYAENIIRSAFISRFVQEGRFKLAESRGKADVICRGTVKSIQISALSYKTSNLAVEERMTLGMEVVFEERASGRVIWENRGMSGTGDYLVSSASFTENNRKNALLKLAKDSAERAYLLMMSDF
jgi:hypothetical protein